MKSKTSLATIGYLLFLLYGLKLSLNLIVRSFNAESLLLIVLLAASVGLILQKEWSRRLLMMVAALNVIYILVDAALMSKAIDYLRIAYAFLSLAIVLFYHTAAVRSVYGFKVKMPQWTILIIDDEAMCLKMLRENFRRCGMFTLTAETGEKGLAMAKRWKPNLILLDVILPGIKGRAVCAKLKEDPATRDIPVLFLTAKDSPDDISAELKAGAVAHITKPVDFPVVYAQVTKILGTTH
jgi:CheY-like chemotaxis protein